MVFSGSRVFSPVLVGSRWFSNVSQWFLSVLIYRFSVIISGCRMISVVHYGCHGFSVVLVGYRRLS